MTRLLICIFLISSFSVQAQSSKKSDKKKPAQTTKEAKKEEVKEEVKAQPTAQPVKKKRFSIAHFGEGLGPALERGDKYRPRLDSSGDRLQGNRPWNYWTQVSFRYKFDNGFEPFINPRVELQFTTTRQYTDRDKSQIRVLDPVTGVRKFWDFGEGLTLLTQFGVGIPVQKSTRAARRDGFVECFCVLDYAPSGSRWIFGSWILPRYNFSGAANDEYWFLYLAPYVAYTINERWQPQIYLEQEFEHAQTKGAKSLNYAKRVYQGAYFGANYTVNPSLIIYPFIRSNALQKPTLENASVGFWVIARLY
jgi:hypothetical protein